MNRLESNHFLKIYLKVLGKRETDKSPDLWVGRVSPSYREGHVTTLKGIHRFEPIPGLKRPKGEKLNLEGTF